MEYIVKHHTPTAIWIWDGQTTDPWRNPVLMHVKLGEEHGYSIGDRVQLIVRPVSA